MTATVPIHLHNEGSPGASAADLSACIGEDRCRDARRLHSRCLYREGQRCIDPAWARKQNPDHVVSWKRDPGLP